MSFTEKIFEDILEKYPELIEKGLTLQGRQVTMYGRRIDLLFTDQHGRKLLIELKRGPIKDQHIGQLLSYEGMLISADDPSLRVMLIGNRVPPNIARALDHHGIAWKEITCSQLQTHLEKAGDTEFLACFQEEMVHQSSQPTAKSRKTKSPTAMPEITVIASDNPDELVQQIRNCEFYKCFQENVSKKIANEETAKNIILNNLGFLERKHLEKVFELVDEPYTPEFGRGLWFGRLLSPNANGMLNETREQINQWFTYLLKSDDPVSTKITTLTTDTRYKISGAHVGMVTLILYLTDPDKYAVWFPAQHNGLRVFYPKLPAYTGRGEQYPFFNDLAKQFCKKYQFDHVELDLILSGNKGLLNMKRKR